MSRRISYLGPEGTFCHEAAMSQNDLAGNDFVAEQLISDVFDAVDKEHSDIGVVPLENTIEGSVALTLDMLVFDSEAMIQREIDHDISLCLASIHGASQESITTVISHPHALAQCREYIEEKLPIATTRATDSTAGAAATLSGTTDKTVAVICPTEAAKRYDLTIVDAHIQDRDFNETRFIMIGRGIPAPTGNDKTSIVCFQRANRPGSLLEIMKEFADRNIDFTKLESRPTKEGLGQYCFLMDFAGHIADENIASCLEKVRTEYADVKFLGSYPVAGSKGQSAPAGTTKVWKDTPTWITDLHAKIEKP